MGLYVSLLAIIPFALFIGFYLHFVEFIKMHTLYGEYLNPGISPLLVCLQGMPSGFVLTLVLMQFYKKRKV